MVLRVTDPMFGNSEERDSASSLGQKSSWRMVHGGGYLEE